MYDGYIFKGANLKQTSNQVDTLKGNCGLF